MATYQQIFSSLNRAALIPFFVIGDPDEKTSRDVIKTAIDAGADILELGIPFSDPVADGPTIQKADMRALNSKMTPRRALDFIADITRYKPIPIGLLVYYNLIFQYGIERFFKDFKSAGGNSVLVADVSIDDADEIAPLALAAGLETVFMATPNCSDQRLAQIAQKTTGFLYTVSVLGTTGQRQELSDLIVPLIGRLKAIAKAPICVGFGISAPQHAQQVAQAGADGVIVGSRLVKIIEDNLDNKDKLLSEVRQFICQMRAALENAPKRC